MSIKDTDRKARKAYKKKTKTVRVELYPTDEDIKARIAERLADGEPMATYIKRLIREDIECGGVHFVKKKDGAYGEN